MQLLGEYIRFAFGLQGRDKGRYPSAQTVLQENAALVANERGLRVTLIDDETDSE